MLMNAGPRRLARAAFLPLKMLSAKEIELQVTEIEKRGGSREEKKSKKSTYFLG